MIGGVLGENGPMVEWLVTNFNPTAQRSTSYCTVFILINCKPTVRFKTVKIKNNKPLFLFITFDITNIHKKRDNFCNIRSVSGTYCITTIIKKKRS